MQSTATVFSAVQLIEAPLIYKGKVRELYDLGEHVLIVVTDRISAFDYVLEPAVPGKGNVLNQLSAFWFERTKQLQQNHLVHTDIVRCAPFIAEQHRPLLEKRIMVVRKAKRIDMECVVRGYITGGGWRQYVQKGEINGHQLPEGLRKNEQLPQPLFTPAVKNDVGHDEDISFARMKELVGSKLAEQLMQKSLALYDYAAKVCEQRGIILADCKLEFGLIDDQIILIDEIFTPDSARFWDKEQVALDIEIESMDKEPVRTYLMQSNWDRNSQPAPLPREVVAQTAERYQQIYHRITADQGERGGID